MLLLPIAAAGQSCEYYLPYSQNFNQNFDLENGYFNPLYDTTLVFYDNCWKQILYRTTGRWPFVGRPPREDYDNLALRLYADHPFEGNDRVEYTYMLSPFFRNTPFVISFDYCNLIINRKTVNFLLAYKLCLFFCLSCCGFYFFTLCGCTGFLLFLIFQKSLLLKS
jgi:hypothetical protein